MTTDRCPNLTGKNIGLLKRIQDQVAELNPDQTIIFLHCIIHQEVLSKCVLKMSLVVDTVTKVVNFIRAKSFTTGSLYHCWKRQSQVMQISPTSQT